MMTQPPDASSTAQWVQELYSPQTRRLARQRLIAAGAVDALLECLQAPNESVVWAAVQSLGELQAESAVEPLLILLEQGTLEMDVAESLAQITGKDAGTNPQQWRRLLGASASTASIDPDQCIAQTANYLGVDAVGTKGTYRFKLSLPDGRSQKVAVYFDRHDAEGHELVVIYSECGPAEPKYYEPVLRKNLSMPFGAFAVRDIDGEPNFVIVESTTASTITPGALARKIEHIAARADQVEKLLTQEDRR